MRVRLSAVASVIGRGRAALRRHSRVTAVAAALLALTWMSEPFALTLSGPAINFVQATPTIATAGMPTRGQLQKLTAGGYVAVVSLVPANALGSIGDEQSVVERAGLRYVHVPVDFSHPRREDFEAFANAMKSLDGKPVFVHCQLNMRASVFVFLYRVTELGEEPDRAFEDVTRVWQPNATWNRFLRAELQLRGRPLPLGLD